jgi:hypothetical protein
VKLSREKILRLSHLILDYLNRTTPSSTSTSKSVRTFCADRRRDAADEAIDALVRRKIESQKRQIPEGSDSGVLYRLRGESDGTGR